MSSEELMGMVGKAIGLFVLLITLSMCASMCGKTTKPAATYSTYDPNTPNKQTISNDYENDLTERCKDWIYNRNKAYKLGREGDSKGSEQARRAMIQFDNDLKKNFTSEQISAEIARLKKSGYKAGF
jgi:hypothetical protein